MCCFSRYTHPIFFRKSSVAREPLDGDSRRATTSVVMLPWYKFRIFSETDLLFPEIYRIKVFFENRKYQEHLSTRGLPVHPLPRSCFLIQGLNFQEDKLTFYNDIPTQSFFESHQYQENRLTGLPSC